MSETIFPTLSKQDWKARFNKELKEATLENLIARNPAEELDLFPYFVASETEKHDLSGLLPEKVDGYWEQVYPVYPNTSNEQILEALNFGANSLYVEEIGPQLDKQLAGVQLAYIQTHFYVRDLDKMHALHLFLTQTDQLGFQGSASVSNPNLWQELNRLFPIQATLETNTLPYHLEGANAILETALALAMGKEMLQGVDCLPRFRFGIGSDYFLELAKFRSFRLLWANIAQHFGKNPLAQIQAETSERECAKTDTDTNLLRLTTMAMSALAGTADALIVHPHDTNKPNATRWALHIQNLLREESYFSKLEDPGFGAYYVEQLTEQLMNKVWSKFLWIEEQGGFAAALKKGVIHAELHRLQAIRNQALQEGKVVKVGVNKYLGKAGK